MNNTKFVKLHKLSVMDSLVVSIDPSQSFINFVYVEEYGTTDKLKFVNERDSKEVVFPTYIKYHDGTKIFVSETTNYIDSELQKLA